MALSGAKRRTPSLTMPVSARERRRSRVVPVTEIEAMQQEMAALRARIAVLERPAKAARKATAKKRHKAT
jgi:hypothetical protein